MVISLPKFFKKKPPKFYEVRVNLDGADGRINLGQHLEIRDFIKSKHAFQHSNLDIQDGFIGVYHITDPQVAMIVKLTWGGK